MGQAHGLRIAFVLEDISRSGGMGRVVLEHAERLASDHEVHLVCATLRDLQNPEITVHRIHLPRLPHVLRIPLFAFRSSAAVRGKDFDVILSQGPNCFAQSAMLMHFCAAACLRRMRSPSLTSLHPTIVDRAAKGLWNAYCVTVERRLCRKLRGRIIAVSEGLARDIAAAYRLGAGDIHIVANGVDTQEFSPASRAALGPSFRAEHGLLDAAFVALFVGGLWALRGLDHAVSALELVGDRDIHLVIVGDGDEEAFGRLVGERACERLHFIGSQTRCHAAYAAADAFVFPTYFEAFPLVALEAASAGLPLLAPAANGVEDILSDGRNGFLIRHDPEDVAAKLCQLYDDPALCRRMSNEARDAAAGFSWDTAARRLELCLRRIHADMSTEPS